MLIKKLVTYEDMGLVQWGVLDETETGVYGDIALEEAFFTPLPETLLEFIRQGNEGLLALADALEQNEKTRAVAAQPLDTVRIMAPIPRVERNIFCIGKNYADHIAEFDKTAMPELPKYPLIFTKATTSVIGPDDLIDPHKNVTSALDYEGELAVIIGKEGSDIPVGEAMDYVYGFTILNDVTARDLQANQQSQNQSTEKVKQNQSPSDETPRWLTNFYTKQVITAMPHPLSDLTWTKHDKRKEIVD